MDKERRHREKVTQWAGANSICLKTFCLIPYKVPSMKRISNTRVPYKSPRFLQNHSHPSYEFEYYSIKNPKKPKNSKTHTHTVHTHKRTHTHTSANIHNLENIYKQTLLSHLTIMTTSSLSINPTLSPPSFSTCSSFSSFSPYSSPSLYSKFSVKVSNFSSQRTKPISLFAKQASGLCFLEGSKSSSHKRRELFVVKADGNINNNNMTITEVREEEEMDAPLLDSEALSRPRRIALFVEPSPFA